MLRARGLVLLWSSTILCQNIVSVLVIVNLSANIPFLQLRCFLRSADGEGDLFGFSSDGTSTGFFSGMTVVGGGITGTVFYSSKIAKEY